MALMVLAALGLLLAACGNSGTGSAESPKTQSTKPASSAEATAEPGIAYEEEQMLHESSVKVSGTETAVMETSKGTIVLEFYPQDAPNTVASFIELAESGYYNGIKFHRVVPNFVAQAGDPATRDKSSADVAANPTAFGSGGPGWTQKAEFNSRSHETGTLAMARTQYDVDSAGSQFYICLSPQPRLDGQYTVFGKVTEGMNVVQSLVQGDEIESVTIRR